MAGKGGGAWKVAYADFVTAMMAFFLVMWITSQSQKIKEAIAHHFNAPYESSKPGRNKQGQTGSSIVRPKKPSVAQNPAEATPRRPSAFSLSTGDPSRTSTVIFFPDDSAALDEAAKERLQRLVPWVAGKPQKLEIRGHCSRRPLSPDSEHQDAWQLSYARCRATLDFLIEQGIPAVRLRLTQSAGFEPYTTLVQAEGQDRNARVEVFLLNEFTQDTTGGRNGTSAIAVEK